MFPKKVLQSRTSKPCIWLRSSQLLKCLKQVIFVAKSCKHLQLNSRKKVFWQPLPRESEAFLILLILILQSSWSFFLIFFVLIVKQNPLLKTSCTRIHYGLKCKNCEFEFLLLYFIFEDKLKSNNNPNNNNGINRQTVFLDYKDLTTEF